MKAIAKKQIDQLENAQWMLHRATHELKWEKASQEEIDGNIKDALTEINEVLEALKDEETHTTQ